MSPHCGVKTFCGIVCFVKVPKHRKSLWPNTFHPKTLDIEIVEGKQVSTVGPLQHLCFDAVFDAPELRNDFVGRQQGKNKVLPQQNLSNAVVGEQTGQVEFCKKINKAIIIILP